MYDTHDTDTGKTACSDERTQGDEAYRLRKRPLQTVKARDAEKDKCIQGKEQGYDVPQLEVLCVACSEFRDAAVVKSTS